MTLGTREMLIVVRARDEASRIFTSLGGSLAGLGNAAMRATQQQMVAGAGIALVGAGLANLGKTGISFLNDAADSAVAYQTQVAFTKTQIDDVGISLSSLSDIGKRVGKELPVNFAEIQPALYDIFSSIEVNAPQAEKLLIKMGEASVGGKTDMVTSGRAIISVLNAFKIPVEKVSGVTDTLFQLVKDGRGTYEEFARTIGNSIPAAVKAGQTFETLSGMMAFLTRNGLSAAMASTSAARAFDGISNPKTVAAFKKFGVEVTDVTGKFRPMSEVVSDLKEKLGGLSEEAQSNKLKELFKSSGGNVQAFRFFSLAINDSNNMLQQLTKDMNNAGGAAQTAYDIMKNSPESKIMLMNNQWEILKETVGEKVLPIKLKLYEIITKITSAFNNLSPRVQDIIIKAFAFTSIFLVVYGTILVVLGAFMIFSGILAIVGVAMSTVGIVALGVIQVLVEIAAAVYFVIKYWDVLKDKALIIWPYIHVVIHATVTGIIASWNFLVAASKIAWSFILQTVTTTIAITISVISWLVNAYHNVANVTMNIVGKIVNYWNILYKAVSQTWGVILQHGIKPVVNYFIDTLLPGITAVMNFLVGLFKQVIPVIITYFHGLWKIVVSVFTSIISWITQLWNAIFPVFGAIGTILRTVGGVFSDWWGIMVKGLSSVADEFGKFGAILGPGFTALGRVWNFVATIIGWVLNYFKLGVQDAWMVIKPILGLMALGFKIGLNIIVTAFKFLWETIRPIIQFIVTIVTGAINILIAIFKLMIAITMPLFKVFGEIVGTAFKLIWNVVITTISVFRDFISAIIKFINGDWQGGLWSLWQIVEDVFGNVVNSFFILKDMLFNILKDIGSGIVNAFKAMWNLTWAVVEGLVKGIIAFFVFLWDELVGHSIIPDMIKAIIKWFASLPGAVLSFIISLVKSVISWVADLAVKFVLGIATMIKDILVWFGNIEWMIIDVVGSAITWLINLGKDIITGLINGIYSMASTVFDWFIKLPETIISAAINFGTKLFSVGTDLLMGLFNGLKDGLSDVVTWVKDHLGTKILDAVKSVFGINSPSTVFHNYGKNIMQGLGNGLKANFNDVQKIMNDSMGILADQSGVVSQFNIKTNGSSTGYYSGASSNTPSNSRATSNNANGNTVVPITIYTQEINPLKHAADLGWMLAVRADGN